MVNGKQINRGKSSSPYTARGHHDDICASANSIFLKPAKHLAILYADRGEFDRDFRHRLMRTHLAIFFSDRGDVAVLKTHVIKWPNLMG